MAKGRFYGFEETCEHLGVDEDGLNKLVADGKLRAFRVNRQMKFKTKDVEALAEESGGAAAPEADPALDADEDAFDIVESEDETVADATEVVAGRRSQGTEDEDAMADDDEILFEDDDLELDDLDDDVSTQEITVQEDAVSDDDLTVELGEVDEAEMTEEMEVAEDDEAAELAPARSGRMSARSGSMRRASIQVEEKSGDLLWSGVMMVTAIAMVFPMMLWASMAMNGFTTGNETFMSGQVGGGKSPAMGAPFKHQFFQGVIDMDINGKPSTWFDKASYSKPSKDAIRKRLVKEGRIPGGESEESEG